MDAFKDAGKKAGMRIWRVENLKMVAIKPEDYGYFFIGDSYICLKVCFNELDATGLSALMLNVST